MKTTMVAVALAATLLAGCSQQQRRMMTWAPAGAPSMPMEQALAQCSYDVARDDRNFDRLFLLSGQPRVGSHGVQGLSPGGMDLFTLCMAAKGYRQDGAVAVGG